MRIAHRRLGCLHSIGIKHTHGDDQNYSLPRQIGRRISALGPGTRKTRHGRITTSDGVPPFSMQRPHLVNPIGQHTTYPAPRRVATETFSPAGQQAGRERSRRSPVGLRDGGLCITRGPVSPVRRYVSRSGSLSSGARYREPLNLGSRGSASPS